MDRAYQGEAPEPRWGVRGKLMMATAHMTAAMGGVGKTQLEIMLAQSIAAGPGGGRALSRFHGGEILAEGRAVLITAQDDEAMIHLRLQSLGLCRPPRLCIYPVIGTGGKLTLFRQDRDGRVEPTDQFYWLRDELAQIPELVFVGIDPLQSFAPVGLDKDNDVSAKT
jgi:hypothetical protein